MEDNIFSLHRNLKQGTYFHSRYSDFYVNDPKLRHIHKASVFDRLLHHAVFRILYPIFDRRFIYDSYSCRAEKGTHAAADRLGDFLAKASANNSRSVYALKCDVRKFFDSVDHAILLSLIEKQIHEQRTLGLLCQIVESFEKQPGIGLPLGNVTSQLFANIYLNELDQFIKHSLHVKYYLRYCDDFIIIGNDQDLLKEVQEINHFLQIRLRLILHPSKITIRKYRQGVDFLGYVLLPHHRVLRTKTKRRVLKRVWSGLKNSVLQSYLGVVLHCAGHKVREQILQNTKQNRRELATSLSHDSMS